MKTKSAFFNPSRFLLCSSLVAVMLCSRFDAWAVPAAPTVHTLQQPDGTAFKARLHGDEFFHYYTTEDGHPLTCDPDSKWFTFAAMAEEGVGPSTGLKAGLDRPPTGAWKPRTPSSELEARKTRKFNASVPSVRRSSARDGEPSPVTANVAMFLTTFSDRVAAADPARPIHQAPAFETLFFDTSDANAFTAANLYKQMSYGLHTVTSGPSGIQTWAAAPKKHEYYGAGVTGSPNNVAENGARVQELVKWRVQNADATFDFGPYDTDNNGVVDLACIVYQGTDQANSGLVNDIWPIRWTLDANTAPGTPGTGPGSYQTADRNAAGNLVRVNDFIVISELFPGPTSPMATIGVFAHEYGHGIGWPDLYDTDYSTAGLGDWCLMSLGCYNRKTTNGSKGDCPSWANAWCRIKSGWLAPQNPTYNNLGYRIPEAKRENFVLKLSLNGAGGLEYFLVENRQRTGWDQGLPGGTTGPASGLMIWHVDDAQNSNSAEWWSTGSGGFTTGGHRLVAMEQADRIFQLDRRAPTTAAPSNVGNSGDGGDLFTAGSSFTDSTVPSSRTYAGTATNVAVRNISAASATDASITADIFMQADQGFPEVLTMNPADGLNYYLVPSLSGTARDDTGLSAVRVALQRRSPSGDEWYGWASSSWQGAYEDASASLSGAGSIRNFNAGITAGHVTPGTYSFFAKAIDTSAAGSGWRESRFTVLEDPNGPDVTISEPSNWENYLAGVVPNFAGTAVNTTGTISVQIAMKMEAGAAAGRFYDWTNNTWSPAGSYGAPNAYLDSRANWVVNMAPRPLGEGNYTLFVRVTSGDTRISPWRAVAYRVGRPFGVTISSPRHQSAMQRLVELSGTVDDPSGTGLQGGAVTLTLTDPAGRYWNGSAWGTGAATFSAPAGSGSWVFTSLPPEADLPAGSYALTASATTNGGESSVVTAGVNAVNFHVDRTPPTGQVTSPVQNAVITTPSLPPFRMTAFDTNGIAWVNCFIRRNADQAFWNGSGWTEDVTGAPDGDLIEHAPPVAFLSAGYNAGLGEWECTSPLPSPASNMRSGSYSFIAIPGDAAGNYFQTESTITVDYHPVYTWTGLTLRDGITGNDSTYWGTPANWSPYGVPGEGDIAVIANGDRVDSTISRTVYGLQLSSGHLNFTNGPGAFGTLTTTNISSFTGGTFCGTWENQAGAVLTISGTNGKDLYNTAILNNAGTVNWSGASLRGLGGCTINNLAGGNYQFQGDGTPFSNNGGGNVFNNAGTLSKLSGSGITVLNQWTYHNTGAVLVNSGTLQFAGTTTFDGGTGFSGTGQVVLTADTSITASFPTSIAGLTIAAGTHTVTPGVEFNGTLDWTSGTIAGTLRIPPGSTLNITGGAGKDLYNGAVLNNAGTINWAGASLRGLSGCTVNNLATGTYRLNAEGTPFSNNGSGNVFNNAGTFIKATGSATATLNQWTYNNSGAVQVASGTLRYEGTTNLTAGTEFSGAGQVIFNHNISLQASIPVFTASPGSLTIVGGTVTVTSGVGFTGVLTWTGGTIAGTLAIPAGSTLHISGIGGKDLYNGAVLNNSGTITWSGASLRGLGDCTVNNLAGGIYRLEDDGTPFSNNGAGNVFNNAGTFIKEITPGTAVLNQWTYNNSSAVQINSGTLRYDGTVKFAAGTAFSGAGQLVLNSNSMALEASVPFFTASTGSVTFTSGVLTVTEGTGFTGTLTWTSGTIVGTLAVPFGSTLNITGAGAKDLYNGAVLNNSGTINWDGVALRGLGGCTVNNLAGGVYRLNADGTPFSNNGTGNVFNHNGTLIKASGDAIAYLNQWTYNLAAPVQVDAGTLRLDSTTTFNSGTGFSGVGHVVLNSAITVPAPFTTTAASFTMIGGSLTASPGAGVIGTLHWNSGTVVGTLAVPSGSTLNLTGTGGKDLHNGAVLNNSGTINWEGVPLRGLGNCTVNNLAGGVYRLNADGTPFSNNGGGNVFNNLGTLRKTAGPDIAYLNQWTYLLAAPVQVDAGTLRIEATATFNSGTGFSGAGNVVLNGLITVPAPFATTAASFTMIGGYLTATAGAGVTGVYNWASGTVVGTLAIPSGSTLNITGAAAKDLYNGAVLNNAGTINWDGASLRGLGDCTINNLATGVYRLNADGTPLSNNGGGNVFHNSGSFLKAAGTGTAALNQWTFNNSSRIICDAGLLNFSALLNLNAGGLLQGTAPMTFSAGQCNLRGTTTQQGALFSFAGGVVSGHADGTGALAGGRWDYSGGTWSGVINVASGGSLFITGGNGKDLYNGAVLENAGTVTYDATASLRGLGGSSIHNQPGATFIAASTAPFTNNGGGNFFTNDGNVTIGPGLSQWTLHWSYTQSSTGALNIEIAGPAAAQYDRLAVAGTATLGGTVSVTKLGGYAPAEGTTFGFLTAGSVTGTFGIVSGGFTGTYTGTTATLRAVAAGLTFADWLVASGFTPAEIANPLISGPNADPDGDGQTNFFEYVHNTNPKTGSGAPQQAGLVNVGGQDFLTLKYRRWADREAAGVTYTPETGASLGSWGTAGIIEEVDPAAPVIPGSTACRCRVPIAGSELKFLRVKAVKP